jgi:two-component system OmpR family response regulator
MGQHLGETEAYDAAVLDLGLPKVPGAAVLRAWRQRRPAFAGTDPDRARRLDRQGRRLQGRADDYLTKPFRIEELIMRLRALVRRSAGPRRTRITCGKLAFDAQTGVFELDGLPLQA